MKTFPTLFAAEIAKKTGIAPVWILKITIGATTYYLSDNAFTIASWNGGITTKAWVQQWGQIAEALGGELNEIRVADLSLTCLIDPDASPNMESLVLDSTLEKSAASLYLWFHGLNAATDPPQEILRGYVREAEIPDETTVNLVIEDESVRLGNLIGTVITPGAYAKADPDDIGRIIPIPYGSIKNAPTVALEAGLITSLNSDITAASTTIVVARVDGWSAGNKFSIADEVITIGAVDSANSQFTGCTRGANSTTAVAHGKGDPLLEVKSTDFVFVLSARAIVSNAKVLVRSGGPDGLEVDITDLCTRYTGAVGSQYTGYSNKYLTMACVTITQAQAVLIRARVLKAGLLSLTDPTHVHQENLVIMAISPEKSFATSGLWIGTVKNLWDRDTTTLCLSSTSGVDAKLTKVYPVGLGGKPTRIRAACQLNNDAYANATLENYFKGTNRGWVTCGSDGVTYFTSWYTIPTADRSWANILGDANTYLRIVGTSQINCADIWWEVEYDPSPPSASTGIIGSVNSLADAILGGPIYCDIDAGKSTPATLFADFLSTYCGVASFSQVGTLPGSYALNGVITEQRSALYWLNRLAFQCRCWFRMMAGTAKLIYRPDSLTSVRTIPACRIADGKKVLSRRKASDAEILNAIDLKYNRDWPAAPGPDAYLAVSSTTDATSITDYGRRERPELFECDFIISSTMADSVRNFYLAQYKRRYWLYEFETFLDHANLEFADHVTLTFSSNKVVELMEVGFSPGDKDTIDVIRMIGRG